MAKFRAFMEVESTSKENALQSFNEIVKKAIEEKQTIKDIIKIDEIFISAGNAKKLYVGNLSFNATEEDVKELFEQCGTVKSVKIAKDHATEKSRGFAFVEVDNIDKAISTLDEKEFMGRVLRVRQSEDKPREKQGFDKGFNKSFQRR
jgi:RNA recognition motif-containing protein